MRSIVALVEENRVSTADLLFAWREAARAAELTARLAAEATAAAEEADSDALANEHLVQLAETAARAAEQAAKDASRCAERARARAEAHRRERVPQADQAWEDAKAREADARDRYQRSSGRAIDPAPQAD